jgi:arylsulfatase A-like enzyme
MDLLGLTGENHAIGTSLVRKVPNRTAVFNNPYAMQYVGLRQGEWKYVYAKHAHSPAVYNLQQDRDETVNVAGEQPELEQQFQSQSVGVTRLMTRHYWQESFAPTASPTPTPQPVTPVVTTPAVSKPAANQTSAMNATTDSTAN